MGICTWRAPSEGCRLSRITTSRRGGPVSSPPRASQHPSLDVVLHGDTRRRSKQPTLVQQLTLDFMTCDEVEPTLVRLAGAGTPGLEFAHWSSARRGRDCDSEFMFGQWDVARAFGRRTAEILALYLRHAYCVVYPNARRVPASPYILLVGKEEKQMFPHRYPPHPDAYTRSTVDITAWLQRELGSSTLTNCRQLSSSSAWASACVIPDSHGGLRGSGHAVRKARASNQKVKPSDQKVMPAS